MTTEQVEKLHGPVGLAIGSKTPAEIAISILAEITAQRHQSENAYTNQQATFLKSA